MFSPYVFFHYFLNYSDDNHKNTTHTYTCLTIYWLIIQLFYSILKIAIMVKGSIIIQRIALNNAYATNVYTILIKVIKY
jgi:hypothetical protein